MAVRNIICIVVDGLRASALGAYGNTWYQTPAVDKLASDALVMDVCYADSLELLSFYRSVWYGQHAAYPSAPSPQSLPELLRERGFESLFLTDDDTLVGESLIDAFDECLLLPAATATATSTDSTSLAELFLAAGEHISRWATAEAPTTPQMLWVHARGLSAAWDAPYPLREALCEESDPEPPTWLTPPSAYLGEDTDPDVLFGLRCAHAAQICALDDGLQSLLDVVDQRRLKSSTLIVLTSPRGIGLAEHGPVGVPSGDLHVEWLHVPLILAYPDAEGQALRSRALVQPPDLAASLVEWAAPQRTAELFHWQRGVGLQALLADDRSLDRDAVLSVAANGDRALLTNDWFLKVDADGIEMGSSDPSSLDHGEPNSSVQLFSKPDDYWEANELARRCPQEALALLDQLRQLS